VTEFLFVIYALLFALTSSVMLLYYRRIRQASTDYSRTKTAIADMALSYNRDLQKQDEKVRAVASKCEENTSLAQRLESEIANLRARMDVFAADQEALRSHLGSLKEHMDAQRNEVLEKLDRLEAFGNELKMPPPRIKSAIPIGRERALAALTQTELRIIQLLGAEGEKSAPEITEAVKLTREHTSRLMKKLYARGYIERRTDRMPYAYRLKRETKDLVKGESTAS